MSDEFCPRQITFSIPGAPGVQVTATEESGAIEFTVDVLDTAGSNADLRGLFFNIQDEELPGLQVTSASSFFTEARVAQDNVLDLGDGANMKGAVKSGFDVGIEWGTAGRQDVVNGPVTFTLSNTTGDLTLDDLGGMMFGARIDGMSGPGGMSGSSSKLLTVSPFAPDAVDDTFNIFEDGAAGLDTPSKSPNEVWLNVLGNDTDADVPPDTLIVTGIHDGPEHGDVRIENGQLYYTPDADFAGTDSFLYCISDGHGGQDNALCTVNIAAVADDPLIGFTIDQGSNINETLVTVTATQNDADGSEAITSLDWSVDGGVPAGVTITPAGPVAGSGDQLVQQFVVSTTAGADWNFDIDFTATSAESSNADTETSDAAQNIDIDFTHNQQTLTYNVADQSIWSTGDEFVFDYNTFLGVDKSISATIGDDDITGTFVKGSASVKAGFDFRSHFDGGHINASIPIDVTVDTTYNRTTDNVYVDPSMSLGSGASFDTTGPEGSTSLDFIFKASASLQASLLWVDLYNDGFSKDYSQNIFDFDSTDPAPDPLTLLGGIVDVGLAWPHLHVTGDTTGSGTSNDFLYLTLDVDQLANALLGGALSFLDSDPTDPDNFELLDLDITGGLNLIQDFALGLDSTTADLTLEDDSNIGFTFGSAFMINHASSHDVDNDGTIDLGFNIDPNVTLSNTTSLGGNIDADLWIPKNFDETLVHEHFDIVEGPLVTLFDDTFGLQGVGSQTMDLVV